MSIIANNNCLLCNPNPKLLVGSINSIFTMVGLGPITPRYLIFATKSHFRSFADAVLASPSVATTLNQTRLSSSIPNRPLLFTEHGRVPICRSDQDDHEAHCFHAHMLAFETVLDNVADLNTYFRSNKSFSCIQAALQYSTTQDQYYLYSPSSNCYTIYSNPVNVPRQFFRSLVAIKHNIPDYADWRLHPRSDHAIALVARERRLLESKK